MAWGSKDQLIAEVSALKRENELLQKFFEKKEAEVEELRKTIGILQDALIAKESPMVYRDMKMAEEQAREPQADPEELKRQQDLNKFNALFLNELEGDLFRDADDMISALQNAAGGPEFESLHGNEES